jgi:ATP-binding cassette, subfamily B, bacterial PglK
MMILAAVWRLLDRPQRWQLVGLQLLSVLMALATVGGIAAVLPFFTVLADASAVERSPVLHFLYYRFHWGQFHFDSERGFVVALGIALALLVALANTVNLAGTLLVNRFAYQVGETFRTALFDEYLNRSLAFHLRVHSSVLESKILHETNRVTSGILQNGLILVSNLITIACIVGSIVLLDSRFAIMALAGLGGGYCAIYLMTRSRLLQNGLTESRQYAERSKIIKESVGAIREIILLHAQPFFVARFARSCRSIAMTLVNTHTIAQTPRHVLESVTVCVLVAVALHASGHGADAGPWIAQLSFVGFAAYRLLPALQQAFGAFVRIRADRPAFESIAADLQSARSGKRGVGAAVGEVVNAALGVGAADDEPWWRGRPHNEIRLEGVSYRYAEEGPLAIANISLRIPAGSVVGFIGVNGSGKTTLLDLVAGLLVPVAGHLEVDGIAVDDANRRAWQARIAQVPQHIFLLDATLIENIAFGIPAAQIDLERVYAAVRMARLEECVAALPGGYHEMLGERGVRLSGGQRQRLGIARALYRDASVLIMDEATSALDAAAESDIAESLMALRRDRTILLIAHRFTTLRHCDLIVELESGRIFRSGTYEGLPTPAAMSAAHAIRS